MSQCSEPAQAASLACLPPCILSQIARNPGHTGRATGQLLATARFGRDAILSTCKAVTLRHGSERPPDQATVRLLHRACTQAHAGLKVNLNVAKGLPILLKPGVDIGGWDRVHSLKVVSWTLQIPAELGAAFPSVQHLTIWKASLGEGSVFGSPNAWRHLCSLTLGSCYVDSKAEPGLASALASLPNLTTLVLPDNPCLGITKQLTRLRHLWVDAREPPLRLRPAQDLISVAARNHQLQSAGLLFKYVPTPLDAHQLQHLLRSCSHLTCLDLPTSVLDQAGLDVLLQHGRCIQSLSVDSFVLLASRADAQCSWQSLSVQHAHEEGPPSILHFAHLPLKNVKVISMKLRWYNTADAWYSDKRFSHSLKHLTVPLGVSEQMPLERLSSLLHKAATNLAACPAWKEAPADTITITGELSQHPHLLSALAPLGGPHIKELNVVPRDDFYDVADEEEMSASTVRALAGSFGNAATRVTLERCTLERDFWAAFTECFPAVEYLDICYSCGYTMPQLLLWCHTMRKPVHVVCDRQAGGRDANCISLEDALEDFGCPRAKFEFR